MPTIRMPDGQLVRFPDEMPPEQIRGMIESRYPQLRPEPTFWGNVAEVPKGLGAGALNLLESGAIGASSLLSDEGEVSARQGLASLIAPAREALAAKPGYEDTMTRKFSEAAGSFLPFLAAAPFGAAGVVAGTALGVGAGAGEARTRAEQKGATADERGLATLLGAGVGASEMLAPVAIAARFNRLKNAVGDDVALAAVDRLKRIAAGAGEEGAQEAAAQLAQNLIAKGVYDPEQGVFTDTGESFGYGAGVGGLAQGLLDLALPGKNRGFAPPQEEAPAPTQEQEIPGGFDTIISPEEDLPEEAAPVSVEDQLAAIDEVIPEPVVVPRKTRKPRAKVEPVAPAAPVEEVTAVEEPAVAQPEVVVPEAVVEEPAPDVVPEEPAAQPEPTAEEVVAAPAEASAQPETVVAEEMPVVETPPAPETAAPVAEPTKPKSLFERTYGFTVGDTVVPSTNVGYSRAGSQNVVESVSKKGVATVVDPDTGARTTWSPSELIAATRRGTTFEKIKPVEQAAPAAPAAPATPTKAAPAAKPTSADLAKAMADFVANGGNVTQLPAGVAQDATRQRGAGEPSSIVTDGPTLESKAPSTAGPEYNADFAAKVDAKATPSQLLDHIARDTRVPVALRTLARNLEKVSARIPGVTQMGVLDPAVAGTHKAFVDRPGLTTINNAKDQDYVQTYLHEHIHALTNFAINTNSPAGRRITQLFEQYKQAAPNSSAYGFETAHEFVSEALTSPEFQQELKKLRVGNTSLWQRLLEYIKSVLGIQTPTKVLDELLSLTKDAAVSRDADVSTFIQQQLAAMAEAQRNANEPVAAAEFMSRQGAVYTAMQTPIGSPKLSDSIRRLWRSPVPQAALDATRKVIAWGLPLPALNDFVQTTYSKKYPQFAAAMDTATKVFQNAEGDTVRFIDSTTPLLARMQAWQSKVTPAQANALNEVYFGGTLNKVDLTKPISTYKNSPLRLKAYRDLKKIFDSDLLGNEGRSLYRQMRAVHDKQFKQMVDLIENQVFSSTQDKALATAVRNKFMQQVLAGSGSLEGYAPLVRPKGKYLLRFFERGADDLNFEIFETLQERDDRIAQIKNDPNVNADTIETPTSITRESFDGVAPNSFIGEILKLMEGANNPALLDSVMQLVVSVSPPNAVLNRIVNRKESPGYKRDAIWAFQNAAIGLGGRLNGLKYNAEITSALRELTVAYDYHTGPEELSTIVEDMRQRGEYAANPQMPGWSNLAKGATYGMTLGFNVSSAIVDMSSLAIVTGPVLSAKYGVGAATREMFAAAKSVMSMGTSADVETVATEGLEGADLQEAQTTLGLGAGQRAVERRKVLPSVMNIDFNDPNLPPEKRELQELVEAMKGSGHSQRYSGYAGAVEIGESNVLSRVSAAMGFMMNSSERIKREIGIVANYQLELKRLAKGRQVTPELRAQAAATALETSMLINGGSTAITGARFQQGAISSVLMMYKRFATLQMYLQFKALKAATTGEPGEVKAAAQRQLAWMFATSAAFAGARGMPLMGIAAAIYNLFVDEEEGEEDFESAMRRVMGNGLTEGIPNALFNVNVGPRIELTNLMMRDTNVREGATFLEYMGAYFGGPAVGSASRAWRGFQLIQSGEVSRGIEQMLPSSVSNALKAYRFTTEGTTTLRGDPVTGDVTGAGALSQALGFAPADYARAMDFTVQQRGIDRKLAAKRTKLYERFYTAYRLGDADGMKDVMEDMVKFNRENTSRPEMMFTNDGIRSSLRTRDRNTQEMIMGALPAAARRHEWMESAEDWGF